MSKELIQFPQVDNSAIDPAQQLAQLGTKNEAVEILKELFDPQKIFMTTDFSNDECIIATRIYMVAKLKGIDKWIEGLQFLASVKLSKNRKSRKELIQGIIGFNQQQQMRQPFGFFGGRR